MSELVIFHKQLGDTVLLEPVLRKLAQASGEQVQMLCPRQFEPVIELMPHARLASGRGRWLPDRLWAYDWGGKTTRAAAITLCREKHLLIPPSRDWVTRAHRFTFTSIDVQPYLDRYLAQYFWDQTKAPACTENYSPPHLEQPPLEWKPCQWNGGSFLLLNPVSAWKRKCYDAESWSRVLEGVRDLDFPQVLMSGGNDDWQRSHCEEIVSAAAAKGVKVTDISGTTNLREFLFLVSRAATVLCVDGAASHLARSFHVPCVTLFGPSYRQIWHQEDADNLALDAADYSQEYRPAVTHIPAEQVVESLKRLKPVFAAGTQRAPPFGCLNRVRGMGERRF